MIDNGEQQLQTAAILIQPAPVVKHHLHTNAVVKRKNTKSSSLGTGHIHCYTRG